METAANTTVNQPPPQPSTEPPQNNSSRKRPLDNNVRLEDSPYYKMRTIVRDLRPHFIEVLRTPDFRNCKAAEEIREKMKIVMDLYKEMIAEPLIAECKNEMASHTSSDTKPRPQTDWASARHAENKSFFSGSISQKPRPEGGRPEEKYIVGGSAFGWNFVTFPESEAIYYGRSKESFRSANVKSQVE